MLLSEVAIILGEEITIGEIADGCEYYASFRLTSIKDGSCLRGCSGFGKTRRLAKNDLAEKLSGKVIVIKQYSQNSFGMTTEQCNKIEIQLPEKITHSR